MQIEQEDTKGIPPKNKTRTEKPLWEFVLFVVTPHPALRSSLDFL